MGFATIDYYVEILSDSLGMHFSKINIFNLYLDLINLFLLMLFTLPLAFVCRIIKNYYLRLLYGLITGLLLQYQMYGICKNSLNSFSSDVTFSRGYYQYLCIHYVFRQKTFSVLFNNIQHSPFILHTHLEYDHKLRQLDFRSRSVIHDVNL